MSVVWKTMFLEYFRETNYMAGLAQLSSSIHVHEEYLEFSLNAYNAIDQIEIYLKQLFGSLQTFEADEQFFKNRLNKLIRDLKNNETSEPYERITRMRNHILDGSVSNKQRLELTQKVTFGHFLAFKKQFLRSLKFTMLISGHLDKSQA